MTKVAPLRGPRGVLEHGGFRDRSPGTGRWLDFFACFDLGDFLPFKGWHPGEKKGKDPMLRIFVASEDEKEEKTRNGKNNPYTAMSFFFHFPASFISISRLSISSSTAASLPAIGEVFILFRTGWYLSYRAGG